MSRNTTVEHYERRSAAAPYRDGILELMEAVLFIGFAAVWEAGRGEILALLAVPIILGGGFALKWLKDRITEPRIGYAEPRTPEQGSPWGGIAFFAVGAVLFAAAIGLFGGFDDPASWRRWAPFLSGYLIGGGFVYLAGASRLRRYWVLAAISVVVGTLVSLRSDGGSYQPVAAYFLVTAAVLAGFGGTELTMFLRRYPRLDNDPDDAADRE